LNSLSVDKNAMRSSLLTSAGEKQFLFFWIASYQCKTIIALLVIYSKH